jgi:hypothetical protein
LASIKDADDNMEVDPKKLKEVFILSGDIGGDMKRNL